VINILLSVRSAGRDDAMPTQGSITCWRVLIHNSNCE